MKKNFLFSVLLTSLLLFSVLSSLVLTSCGETPTDPPSKDGGDVEFLASTQPANRNAVLEDFTGVRCGYCPDGHVRAAAAAAANPGRFLIIAVHTGSYAAPATGWANFTSPYGQALNDQSGVAGYPAGTINRVKATEIGCTPQKTGGIAMSRGDWAKGGNAIMALPSYVNLGSKADFDAASRKLTVKVDAYYTGDAPDAGNNLNVAFLQDSIISKQSGGGDAYVQNHVLRTFITGQWGETLDPIKTTKNSKVSRVYTYDVPENFNGSTIPPGGGDLKIENCKILVFVSEGKTNIVTGIELPITVK